MVYWAQRSGYQHVKCENRGMFKIIYFQVKTVQGSSQQGTGQSQGYYDYSRNKFVLPNGRLEYLLTGIKPNTHNVSQ